MDCAECMENMTVRLTTDIGNFQRQDGYGLLLTETALHAGLQLNTRCGGQGSCGGCACKLGPGDYVIQDRHVTVEEGGYHTALACQTRVMSSETDVHFPRTSVVEQKAQIDEDFVMGCVKGKPLSHKVCVSIPSATTQSPTPDWNRVQQALAAATGIQACSVSMDVLRNLTPSLAAGNQRISVTMGLRDGRWEAVDIEPGDTTRQHLGVAVDIGTTTVAAVLVDLNQGTILAKASMYNQQIQQADDVASRISACRSPKHLDKLRQLIVKKTINPLIQTLCTQAKVKTRHIVRVSVSGNTVMAHLFLGLSPEGIGTLPFQPITLEYPSCPARQLGLSSHANGLVDIIPSVSGYIGGDITADIYMAKLHKHPESTLLVDIGTNGEIVYSEGSTMAACATAAGPAFEGYGIQHGCRAADGSVEQIRFDETLQFNLKVIGGSKPAGLCGSGIIDFLAEGLRCGLINQMGRFNTDMLQAAGAYLKDEALCGNSVACVIADAESSGCQGPVFISELDISQLMKAKAAIYAGMKTLLTTQGKTFADIQRFCLAGGFARYINLESAITIGLLPEIPLERFEVIGNGSLAGAFLALIEEEAAEAYKGLMHIPEIIELNTDPGFEPNFIDALALPNLNPDDFSETTQRLTNQP